MSGNLQGKRYIGLLSSDAFRRNEMPSADEQLITRFARDHALAIVDHVTWSRSPAHRREAVEQLITRKRQQDDYDAIVVARWSRLVRSGDEFMYIHHRFEQVGVRLLSASEGGEFNRFAALMTAASISVSREVSHSAKFGRLAALQNGRNAHSNRSPYGTDLLYLDRHGTAVFRVRRLADGSQVQFDPWGVREIRRFASDGPGYHKQPGDRVTLVPGAPDRVAAVRLIFRRHFVDQASLRQIAADLNLGQADAPAGKQWSSRSVARICNNPVYLGRGLFTRWSGHQHEFRCVEYPALYGAFVDAGLRDHVFEYQNARLTSMAHKPRYPGGAFRRSQRPFVPERNA